MPREIIMLLALSFVDVMNGILIVSVAIGLIVFAVIYSKRMKRNESESVGDNRAPDVNRNANVEAGTVFDLPDTGSLGTKGTYFDLPDPEPALSAEPVPNQAESEGDQTYAVAIDEPEAEPPDAERFEITDEASQDEALPEHTDETYETEPEPMGTEPPAQVAEPEQAELPVDIEQAASEADIEDQPATIPPSSQPFVASMNEMAGNPLPPQKRPIPPRRPRPEITPPPVDEEPDVIEVVTDDEILHSEFVSSDDDVVSELRLALEASHNELSHLTAARDRAALSVAEQHEREIAELRRQLGAFQSQQTTLGQENERLSDRAKQLEQNVSGLELQLETSRAELSEIRSQVPETPVEEVIQQIEEQHLTTVNELRTILGQREAAEASLERERDSLATRIAELQRKTDSFLEQAAAEQGESADSQSLQRIGELELTHQQVSSELSLANETVRQLNQNLSMRDAQVMELQRAHESLETAITELRESAAAKSEPDPEIEAERERLGTELEASQQALASASDKNSQLAENLAALEASHGQLRAERDRLVSSLNAVEAEATERTELETQRVQALAELESIQKQFAAVVAANETLQAGRDELQSMQQKLLAEKEQLAAETEATRTELAQVKTELQEHLQTVEQTMAKLAEQEAAQQASEECRAELAEDLADKSAQLQRVQHEQIELKQQLAHLIDSSEAWEAERLSLYQKLGLDENGEALLDEQTAEGVVEEPSLNEEALAQIQRLETVLGDRERDLSELQKKFEQLEENHEAAEDASARDENGAEANDALRAERDQAAAAAAEASATIASLMSELKESKSASSEMAATVAKLEEDNRSYRSSMAELHAVANELDELRDERSREQENARQRLHEATSANAELSAELAEVREHAAAGPADETATELSEENERLQHHIAELKTTVASMKQDHDEQQEQVAKLTEELAAIPKDKKEAGKLARQAKQLNQTVERQTKKLEESEVRIQDLASALSKARVESSSLRSELAQQKAMIRTLNGGVEVVALENGRAAKSTSRKKTSARRSEKPKTSGKAAKGKKSAPSAKRSSSSGRKSEKNLGQVFTQPPADVDDLKKISGVGPALEKRLNAVGIYQFSQVKSWTKSTIDHLDSELSLGGRIARDNWVAQARKLAK